MSRLASFLVFLCALLVARSSAAEVARLAVLVGHNRGEADEANLRYAEADAEKVRDLLLDLGGFKHENVVLMQGEDAVAVRQAIVALNQRIRALPDASRAVLVVYYSGHADAQDLHLGGTRFSIRELEQLVAGSAAAVRLLILDSCRSGALTRVKGGQRASAFAVELDERLVSEGAVVLTSSSANEDAQESELLKGSFFTHYLVSGALGAADENGDARVSLTEAYRYAYDHTLRASSRTLAGVQHPTFRYDLSGHGEVILTNVDAGDRRRGRLSFPAGSGYLILKGDAEGPVIAEVGPRDQRRVVSVREGRYFIRARGREHLLEGVVEVQAGKVRLVLDDDLARIAYARLVRKGTGGLGSVHGAEAGLWIHTALANADSACWGGSAGYAIDVPSIRVALRLGYCRSAFSNENLDASIDELGLEVRLGKALDTRWITLEPFVAVGGGVLWQRFDTRRNAPSRTSAAAHVDAGLTARTEVHRNGYLFVDGAVQTYWFRRKDSGENVAPSVGISGTTGIGFWL
ncbi:caspase family protein [Sorangium sp. So ce1128]